MRGVLQQDRPTPADPRDYRFPSARRHTLPNGLRVLTAQMPSALASLSLVSVRGAAAEPLDLAGTSALLGRVLLAGSGGEDAVRFAERAEQLGIVVAPHADFDSLRLNLEVVADRRDDALALLARAVTDPSMLQQEINRLRSQLADEVRQELATAPGVAGRVFPQQLFTAADRYRLPVNGDVASLGRVDRSVVVEAWQQLFVPDQCALVVVGPFDHDETVEAVSTLMAGWSSADAARIAERRVGVVTERQARLVVVDRPGSAQSALIAGHRGPRRSTPDWVAATSMAACLGGLFNSRLNYRLREERGYTYSAFGGFDMRRDAGIFSARCAVHTSATVPALADLLEVLQGMQNGVTAAELDAVRRFRHGVFPVSYERPGAVAGALADLVVHDLPDGYHDDVREQLRTVELDPVNAAAIRHLHPDELLTVVVGDATAFREQLSDLGDVSIEPVPSP